jgi:hypothetical protein
MKHTTVLLSALAAVVYAGHGTPVLAGTDDGVKCPSGYSSNWNSDTKVLRCSKSSTTWVVTVCPPPPSLFTNYNVRNGRDRCTLPGVPYVGNLAPNQFANAVCSLSGYSYVNDGGDGDRDRCDKTQTEYAYPSQL